ncbi:3-methyl-2-oxobutanoate hydroxymethyltransferase [Fusibacter ferrireducens]|uniref:3-methyl-2-oxobutanoate hydroxymethyltransferase n=1 Tax=Fusibacter ferrireducens TaxID=2785058 RepID=A0ABR9ZY55_9FIRM|nr:3-methyl-2-oxobutanoate hydroxymethyltransferase [Fusibacter ferrireducens]MBF4695392.1 3-methyl-2-oxobutanoate hydroxymethyltransferase [Fusibacter ferrireducens]
MSKVTTSTFLKKKLKKEKITILTAYDYSTAKLLDQGGVDCLLVGDSLGMTMLGYEDTLSVTMADMIHHTKAVVRGTKNAMVVADMPFMSYHVSVEDAIRNAGRLIQEAGAHAVKLEGGSQIKDKIEGIINAQIPIMGHLGLTPQSVNAIGGFKVQGKSEAQAQKLVDEAKLLESLGCFAIVLECIPAKLAKIISESISIPTIGIGAGVDCDGQVLVIQDLLGMYTELTPKFVKQYAVLNGVIEQAVKSYCDEVKDGVFPTEAHTFKIDESILEKLY